MNKVAGWVLGQGLGNVRAKATQSLGRMGSWTPREGSHSREQDQTTSDWTGGAPAPSKLWERREFGRERLGICRGDLKAALGPQAPTKKGETRRPGRAVCCTLYCWAGLEMILVRDMMRKVWAWKNSYGVKFQLYRLRSTRVGDLCRTHNKSMCNF